LFKAKSISELEALLDEALRNEDYMKAAQIRDEIDQRK
jgi:protein-arginine kinase activator protein McsA